MLNHCRLKTAETDSEYPDLHKVTFCQAAYEVHTLLSLCSPPVQSI